MLYKFWQLKISAFVLCLALSLGQELLPTCERDYCYEQLIERRSTDADYLRESNGGKGFHRIKEEHPENVIRKVHENRVKISDFESRGHVSRRENLENRRELDYITSKCKELIGRVSNRIRNENRVVIDDISAVANEDCKRSKIDFLAVNNHDNYRDISFDEIRRIERFGERTVERRQNPVENEREDRLVTTRRLNERDNQQDKNQEFLRFIDRRKNLVEISNSESSRENREIRLQADNLILNRRELREDNKAIEEENRRSGMSKMNLLTVDKRNNYQYVDRRFDEIRRSKRFSERTFERKQSPIEYELENRSVTSKRLNERQSHQDENRDAFRFKDRLSQLSHVDHLNERDESTYRLRSAFGEHTDNERRCNSREDLTGIEANNQRDKSNDDSNRIPNERVSENKSRFERDESRRLEEYKPQLVEREQLNENHRYIERHSEENRQERDKLERNHEARRYKDRFTETERLSEKLENLRRLSERENRRFNERLSLSLNKDFSECDNKRGDMNRESLNLNERPNRRPQGIPQLYSENEQERQKRECRKNVRQLDNQDNRYDISRLFDERTRRQSENNRDRVDNRARISKNDSKIKEGELEEHREIILRAKRHVNRLGISSELNSRLERQYDNLRERENVLNRSYESQRLNSRLADFEAGALQNRDESQRDHFNRRIREHENYKEHRNIRGRMNENREFRSIDERQDILSYDHMKDILSKDETLQYLDQIQRQPSNRRIKDHENYRGQRDIWERLDENREYRSINERQNILLDIDIESQCSRTEYILVEKRDENIRKLDDRRSGNREGHRDNNIAFSEDQAARKDHLNHPNNHSHDEIVQRHNKNKRSYNQRSRLIQNEEILNMIDEYKEKPIFFLNKGYMAFGQGALLAYVIMKTLNSKNDIKYNIYQNLQETLGLMGF